MSEPAFTYNQKLPRLYINVWGRCSYGLFESKLSMWEVTQASSCNVVYTGYVIYLQLYRGHGQLKQHLEEKQAVSLLACTYIYRDVSCCRNESHVHACR